MRFSFVYLLVSSALLVLSGFAHAQQGDPKVCFEQKDKACLKEAFATIFDKPTPEKIDAIYLLGLLYLEEENYEDAKSQFEMGMMFGDTRRSQDKYIELVKSGNIEIEPSDCLAIKSEECLVNVAEDDPDKAPVAYYHLARLLSESDAERAAESTIKAAELGHRTAACLLAYGYGHEKASGPSSMAGFVPQLPKDYKKARAWGETCGHGPYVGYIEKHFKKYEGSPDHKAYAKFGGYGMFQSGLATPEYAASLAAELCHLGSKKKPANESCTIVSVDSYLSKCARRF